MTEVKRYTVTAALPYANGPLHIGHIAGCFLPADIFVRYLRSKNKEVIFVCGTDEHGVPITIKAAKEGKTPQEVVDFYHRQMDGAFEKFGISFDIFSRTTNKIHHETASAFFKTLYDKGVFSEQQTEQFYDEAAGQFLADRYITGTCPHCKFDKAYGDQCENCGRTLNPEDLIEPKSALSGNTPVKRQTTNWYLPLDKIQEEFLNDYIESHKHWRPTVYGQCNSWLKDGLRPRAMTRDLDWGVPVPVPNSEGKVLYVWFDAPIGYISATRELKGNDWEKWWKDEDTRLIHFIGKDNIVFHCLIFPAMLHTHGGFITPYDVPANEFLNLEGQKISTSRNHAIWLHEYLEDFPDRQDELRYVLTSIAPETKDADFTWKDFQARVNNELAAILGNLVNRVTVLTHKYFQGLIPEYVNYKEDTRFEWPAVDDKIQTIERLIEGYEFREAQQELMNLARMGNKFLADTEPWHLIKTDEAAVKQIMHICLQLLNRFAEVAVPFLPFTSRKIKHMLNAPELGELLAGHTIGESSILFKRIEDSEIELQMNKLEAAALKNAGPVDLTPKLAPAKDEITYDDFSKMDIRIGTILEAIKVPKADKLLQLTVDTGMDTRTIVSGIAEHFTPEEIIGKQVSILVNLAPRMLRGIESKGMILLAESPEGKLIFVTPENAIAAGSVVR
jgi:methionyl-tRNA synthetase